MIIPNRKKKVFKYFGVGGSLIVITSLVFALTPKGKDLIKSYFAKAEDKEPLGIEDVLDNDLKIDEAFIDKECADVFEALKTFNSTVSSSNFRKSTDKDKQLVIDWNQMMSNNIYLNANPRGDYSDIFSEYHLDTKQINKGFDQVALIYLMYLARATKPSGFGELITTDDASKDLFEKFEKLHIDSNKLSAADNVFHAKKVIEEYSNLISFLKNNKDKLNPGVVRLILITAKRFEYSWAYSTVAFPNDLAKELGKLEGTFCVKTETLLDLMVNSSIAKLTLDNKAQYNELRSEYIKQLKALGVYNLKVDTNLMANDPLLFDKNVNGVTKPKASDIPSGTVIKKKKSSKKISEKELSKESPAIKKSAKDQKKKIEDKNTEYNNKEIEGANWYSLGYETARSYAFDQIKADPSIKIDVLKGQTFNHVYNVVKKPDSSFFLKKFNSGIEVGFNQAVKDAAPYIDAKEDHTEIIIFEKEDDPLINSSNDSLSSQINSLKDLRSLVLASIKVYEEEHNIIEIPNNNKIKTLC